MHLPGFIAGWFLLSPKTVFQHELHLHKMLNSEDSSKWLNGSKYFDKASFRAHMVGKVALIEPHSLSWMHSARGPAMRQAQQL